MTIPHGGRQNGPHSHKPRRRPAAAGAMLAAAALVAAGCASSANGTGGTGAAAAPSCHAQYESWKHGTAKTALATFTSSLRAVQSAGTSEDLLKLRRGLERAGRASTRLAATPPPKCADPHGYYAQLLGRITAAGDNARSASGLGGLMLAEAPLKAAPPIEKKLRTELIQTVGKNH